MLAGSSDGAAYYIYQAAVNLARGKGNVLTTRALISLVGNQRLVPVYDRTRYEGVAGDLGVVGSLARRRTRTAPKAVEVSRSYTTTVT